ncbi:unnamed protein product [Jaminaea pallidilutea]
MDESTLASSPLMQQYFRQNGDLGSHNPEQESTDAKPGISQIASSILSKVSTSDPTLTSEQRLALIQELSGDLTSLRWISHSLSEDSKAEKQKVAEMKARVDEARLKLENARLEERELREEIRREEAE